VPILLAFVLAYLFYPIATLIDRVPKISWRMAVSLLYLLLIVVLGSLITLSGYGIISQILSLITLIEDSLVELPALLNEALLWINQNSPVPIDVSVIDTNAIVEQLLTYVQPLLGSTGQLLGTIASGAAGFFGRGAIILIVSYFIMTESGGLRRNLLKIEVPGYGEDFRRLGQELARIWNSFLRGQMIVFSLAFVMYSVLLSILGMRYAIGLALLAGLAKFLPYIGPFFVTVTLGLVAYFQPVKPFDLPPLTYLLIVFAVLWVFDNSLDSLVTPRIMGQVLSVHPAAVLVSALVGADLLGILGVIIASPMLATFVLFFRYTMRKMLDQDPWPEEKPRPPPQLPWTGLIDRIRTRLNLSQNKGRSSAPESESTKENQPQGEQS
jgi:predicted PurR-regulated permease PerM